MRSFVIIPSCSDLNRGDQALVWETKRLAEESGFIGDFYFQTEHNEPNEQSEKEGLIPIYPILEHPSRKSKRKDNIKYTKTLKLRWGIIALGDLIISLLLLFKPTQRLFVKLLPEDKRRSFDIFKESEAVFMKGGGLLQTHGGIASTYSMYFWTYPIRLAHNLKKPVYIMPNSFGPFEGPIVKIIAKNMLAKCKLVSARESISREVVYKELGLKIPLYADLAFGLAPSEIDKGSLLRKYDIPNDKKLVALTMRPYRFPNSTEPEKAYRSFEDEMTKFIKWLSSEGYMPVLVEHTLAVNAHEDDGACINDITKNLEPNEYRLVSNKEYSCRDLKRIYSFFDYIVGTRFHSVIFSFGSGVPGIAISYAGNKSKGIMHDIGLDEYVLCIDSISKDALVESFNKLILNETVIREKIHNYKIGSLNSYEELIKHMRQINEK